MTEHDHSIAPKPRRTQAERTAASDAAMFKAATQLILTKGIEATTLREVGEKAGYSRGMASYRFGTKDNLIREMLNRFQKEWATAINSATQGKRGLAAFLTSIQTWDEFVQRDTDDYRVALLLRFQRVRNGANAQDGLRSTLKLQQDAMSTWLKEAQNDGDLRPDADARHLALQHISFMFGTMYQLLLTPDSVDMQSFIAGYVLKFKEQYVVDQNSQPKA